MRQVLLGDLLALADALHKQGAGQARALTYCSEAHAAHAYVKRYGRLHPLWGNGSLMSRTYADGATQLSDWSQCGLGALETAAGAIAAWRAQRLDCRPVRLYGRKLVSQAESDHGRVPAQTDHHRPGLGTCLCRGA